MRDYSSKGEGQHHTPKLSELEKRIKCVSTSNSTESTLLPPGTYCKSSPEGPAQGPLTTLIQVYLQWSYKVCAHKQMEPRKI